MPSPRELENLRSVMSRALAGVCFIQAWVILFAVKIGPVVAVLGNRGHGIHQGDLLAMPLLVVALVLAATGSLRGRDAARAGSALPL